MHSGAQMLGEADDATTAASQAADKLPAVIAEKQNEAQAAQKIAEERSSKARLANDHASKLAKESSEMTKKHKEKVLFPVSFHPNIIGLARR